MGLFSRKPPEPQGPVANLQLSINGTPDTVFKPDDQLSGQVTLTTPFPITPQAIEVSLWGLSQVWIRTSHSRSNGNSTTTDYRHYRDHAPLFTVTINILPAHPSPPLQTFQPGQPYTFPFTFRIPEGTANNRSECYKDPLRQPFTVVPHHLPPTFSFGDANHPDNCSISYGLTAQLVYPGTPALDPTNPDPKGPLFTTTPINFSPLSPHSHAPEMTMLHYPKPFTLSSSILSGTGPTNIGFRQRLHDRFSSSTPKLDFELGIDLPDKLTCGANFPFKLSFTVLQKSENVVHIPALQFKILKLEMLDFTFFRACRDWSASNTMSGTSGFKSYVPKDKKHDDEEYIYRETKTLLNSLPESQVAELAEMQQEGEKKGMVQAGNTEVWFSGRVPGYLAPSFVSFAVVRAYRVKIKVGVEIGAGGKMFEFGTESHCVVGSA